MKPGTVSLEKLTKRVPCRTAASSTLNVLIMLLPTTTCGGLWTGCGMAAVDDDVAARATTCVRGPASVRSTCQ